ncbi:uncharacterized protein LOC132294579 [Cornus florida]|uniref:uncharacterized protein LOC132294579 n=1 Tax=Cornus florida TaxID=4283 RepID=UPI002896D434|nr:uncharacterized protein LOC132294579 [Cornus florida]
MGFLYYPQRLKSQSQTTITCLILLSSLVAKSFSEKPTAYEVIEDYDFPMGILPKGVTGYDLDESTGKFSAYLNGTCNFSIEGSSYQLSYKSTIKGHISQGKLSNLQGVKVKLFFFWVDIVEVDRRGDDLEFSVGITSAGFSIDNFEECPQCGCGFNCGSGQVSKLRTNLLGVSSSL